MDSLICEAKSRGGLIKLQFPGDKPGRPNDVTSIEENLF
jgi:hypothetical protein